MDPRFLEPTTASGSMLMLEAAELSMSEALKRRRRRRHRCAPAAASSIRRKGAKTDLLLPAPAPPLVKVFVSAQSKCISGPHFLTEIHALHVTNSTPQVCRRIGNMSTGR
ncbi:Protein of unknown function [Gryllus bimaculatus]|nr:Protein of unknown function [Gryllus bimaculatus]